MLKLAAAVVGAMSLLGSYFLVQPRHEKQAEGARVSDRDLGAATRTTGVLPSRPGSNEKATAQDQEVGELRGALLRAALAAGKASEPSDAFTEATTRQQLLDQRLASAPFNPELTAQLEQALDGAFPSDFTHTLTCHGSLCRVDLSGASALNEAMEALVDKLPKRFAASTVLATSATRRAIFTATDPSQLRVTLPSASQIVSQAR